MKKDPPPELPVGADFEDLGSASREVLAPRPPLPSPGGSRGEEGRGGRGARTRRADSPASRPVAALTLALAALALTACKDLFPHRSPGEVLYRQHCAECHGLDGAGNTPLYMGDPYADLKDDLWRTGGDSDSMDYVVRQGVFGKMPAFDRLTSEEVRQVVDYVRELRGEKLSGARR